MNYREAEITKLREHVRQTVLPLIDGDVHLTNLPYHINMGDGLIWRGTEDLIASTGRKILSRSSFLSFTFPHVKPGEVIVLNGGGNFGDLWMIIMDFFLKVIATYPNNRIIMLPQSAHYSNYSLIDEHSTLLAKHRDLHLIARDGVTYNLFSTRFSSNKVYLAPDMAYAINPERLKKWNGCKRGKSVLYLRRIDKEWNAESAIDCPGAYVSDWPTITSPKIYEKLYFGIVSRTMWRVPHNAFTDATYWKMLDATGKRMVLERFFDRACKFALRFDGIITTRLHVMILATLLNIPVRYIDNTSGKLSAYAETWLKDFANVSPYEV